MMAIPRASFTVAITVMFLVGTYKPGGAESGFLLPPGWTSRPALKLKGTKRFTVPRHLLIYMGPQLVDAFPSNLVINSVDTSIDAQVADNRTWIRREGAHVLMNRSL